MRCVHGIGFSRDLLGLEPPVGVCSAELSDPLIVGHEDRRSSVRTRWRARAERFGKTVSSIGGRGSERSFRRYSRHGDPST
jgi:hypothetical protein